MPVRLAGEVIEDPIESILDLASVQRSGRLLLVTSRNVYSAMLMADSLIVDPPFAGRGNSVGEVLEVTAATEDSAGIVIFDRQVPRITLWDATGRVREVRVLSLGTGADTYVAGGGVVLAVSSERGMERYERVTGMLSTIDRSGYTDSVVAKFPTRALRTFSMGSHTRLMPRPLEHQPLIRWSRVDGWIVATSDSLHLDFMGTTRSTIAGTGRRAGIDAAVRDSALDSWTDNTGYKHKTESWLAARERAHSEFFGRKSHLQLIDEVLPFANGSVALRRMQLCRDRQGWNLLSASGESLGSFGVPLHYQPVATDGSAIVFANASAQKTELMIVRLPLTGVSPEVAP